MAARYRCSRIQGRRASAHYIVSYKGQITRWCGTKPSHGTPAIGITTPARLESSTRALRGLPVFTRPRIRRQRPPRCVDLLPLGMPMIASMSSATTRYPIHTTRGCSRRGTTTRIRDPIGPGRITWPRPRAGVQASQPAHIAMKRRRCERLTSATGPGRRRASCHLPISGYTRRRPPGNLTMNLPPTATSASFNGLKPGVSYTFTVHAVNADGQDSVTSKSGHSREMQQHRCLGQPASQRRRARRSR